MPAAPRQIPPPPARPDTFKVRILTEVELPFGPNKFRGDLGTVPVNEALKMANQALLEEFFNERWNGRLPSVTTTIVA